MCFSTHWLISLLAEKNCTKGAASANEQAAALKERAARLENEAEQARTAQRQLEKEIVQSRSEEAKMKSGNLELQLQVGKERVKRAELEQRLEPRALTSMQKRAISASLSSLGAHQIVIVANMNDHEAIQYAEQFMALFKSVGWAEPQQGIDEAAMTSPIPVGLRI